MCKLITLLNLGRDSRIDIEHLGLRYESTNKPIKELNFHHIDGMYSYCTDDYENVINLRADTEVKFLKKYQSINKKK